MAITPLLTKPPMRVPYEDLKQAFLRVLLTLPFPEAKAEICAGIFADNSRDGVHSHGLHRFPVFVKYLREGHIDAMAEPECTESLGAFERWRGNGGPGMYNARVCMARAIELAGQHGIGGVVIADTNHWMRGGTYGWQAAEAGCIGICTTNTIANMPPWGGTQARLGNNPLIIAVPRAEGHIVLDMALSQFSYGKLQQYDWDKKPLPVPGGYDAEGRLSTDAGAIRRTERSLPVGFWKGSGLSLVIDALLTALSGGRNVAQITSNTYDGGNSQLFLCIRPGGFPPALVEEIIDYARGSATLEGQSILYPGESALAQRRRSELEGVEVNETAWGKLLAM